MPGKAKRLYWDANVFIHYIEATPAYIATLDELFEQAEKNEVEILTSILSIAEVAFHAEERRRNRLDAAIEAKIDLLWEDRSVINLIEVNQLVALEARDLIRYSVSQGWTGLRGADAIHLASARRLKVDEIHVYERGNRWMRYAGHLGCTIREPWVDRPKQLPLPDSNVPTE